MTCIKCKGQMIVWEKDRFGHAKSMPCPLCNKSGQGVAKKLAEIKKKETKGVEVWSTIKNSLLLK